MGNARSQGQSGFTLIEMLVVVAIIFLMGGSIAMGFVSFQKTSNFRNDRMLLASYIRSAQRYAVAYRKDVCIRVISASSSGATNDEVQARFITGSCAAAAFDAGTTISGIGIFTPTSTVDVRMNGGGTTYMAISYTMTGSNYSVHMSDEDDYGDYGTAAGQSKYYTFTLVSTAGRVEVFPCGRNAPWAADAC